MAYLEPASNTGSKPQRLGVTNCKSSTSDKLQTFRTIFGISCKFLTKNYLHEITLFVLFWRGISYKRNHKTFQENKEKNQWFERKCPVDKDACYYAIVWWFLFTWACLVRNNKMAVLRFKFMDTYLQKWYNFEPISPAHTDTDLWTDLDFHNSYLSLLYFWLYLT